MKQNVQAELGAVQVHNQVIADIVSSSIKEIDGVSLVSEPIGVKVLGFLGRPRFPGIRIKVDAQNNVSLEIKVNVRFGVNIPDVSRHIQDAVKTALDKTVDINLKTIDVHIQGIKRG